MVNPNGINTLLANGLSTFFINPVIIKGPRILPRNSPNYIISDSRVVDIFILAD